MHASVRSVWLDLLSGLVAIFAVVGTAVVGTFAGSDLRALFAMSAGAFFLAGLVRGHTGIRSPWLKAVAVSSPGLLGDAALIANDGLNRLLIPVTITITSILFAAAGIQTRRLWSLARRRSVVLGLASMSVLGLTVLTFVPRISALASWRTANRSAPSFSLSAFDGTTVRSSELGGRVVVLVFWASWCLPCHWELPELDAVYAGFKGDARVAFWAVDTGWTGETEQRGKTYLARRRLNLPGAFDTGATARAFGVDSLPTLILIDQQGRIRMVHYGYDASEHVGLLVSRSISRLLGGADASNSR